MLSNARLRLGPTPKSFTSPAKGEIFAVDTVLGRVSASHNPAHILGGPNGVYLKNTILVTIVRIPSDGDQRSEVMAITIPN
jgi:hypothetical protein